MEKTMLLASFIFPERLEWFLGYLETKFKIDRGKVFGYKNLGDESKVIVTFKFTAKDSKRINLKDLFPNAIPIHKKGSTLYTINALNRLIDNMTDSEPGNTDYKSVKINWSEYENKIILLNGKDLSISDIERVF
jgi:hypothetical protein